MKLISHGWQWLERNRREVGWGAAVAILLIAILVLTHGWWDEIRTGLEHTNVYLFFALLCVLPLGGMSIGLMYLVVGARFGGPMGLVVVAAATAVHLAGTHLIAHSFLRRPLEGFLRRRKYRLPQLARREPVAFAMLGALVPGIPYVVRNYLLALSGVPFRIYALICWPIYVVRSGVAIFLGDWVGDLNPGRIAILVAVFAVKVGTCGWIVWHLRRKHGARRASTAPSNRRARAA